MPRNARAGLISISAIVAAACSSASSSPSGATAGAAATFALHGAYVSTSAGGTVAGSLSSLTFLSATTYTGFRSGCVGRGCRVNGTYTFDGKQSLALTDGTTGATQQVAISAITTSTSSDASDGGTSSSMSLSPRDVLVGSNGSGSGTGRAGDTGSLVSAGAALLPTIAACSMNGAAVQNLGDSDPDSSTDPTTPLVIPITASPGTVSILVSVGGSAPVSALLDTGSVGLWINPNIIPAGHSVDIGPAHTGYGATSSIQGEARRAFVRLSGTDSAGTTVSYRTNEPIVVGEANEGGATCSKACSATDDNPLGMGNYQAILGIGLGRTQPMGILSPIASMGQQSWQLIMHVGRSGNANATLTIDPSSDMIDTFLPSPLWPLTLDGSGDRGAGGGFLTNNIPFCVNAYCPYQEDHTTGALLDSGETDGVILDQQFDDELTKIGVSSDMGTAAAGSPSTITGVALNLKILGIAAGSFPADPMPTGGKDLFQLRHPAAGNNLGILAFRRLEVFYDGWNGSIGLAPIPADELPP